MSFVRVYIHAVWAVKYRQALILPHMRKELNRSVNTLLHDQGQTPIITRCVDDHLHTLFCYKGDKLIRKIMQTVKGTSSRGLNSRHFNDTDSFQWQGGYGAFSVSQSRLKSAKRYVENQEAHHAYQDSLAFLEEYDNLVKAHQPESGEHIHYFDELV